jgi:hypothetical protein
MNRQPLNQHPARANRPSPAANRLAHQSIREQTRQGSTSRDRETAKLLAGPAKKGRAATRCEAPGEVEGLAPIAQMPEGGPGSIVF